MLLITQSLIIYTRPVEKIHETYDSLSQRRPDASPYHTTRSASGGHKLRPKSPLEITP